MARKNSGGTPTTVRFVQMAVLMVVATAGLAAVVELPWTGGRSLSCHLAAGVDPDRLSTVHVTRTIGVQETALNDCVERQSDTDLGAWPVAAALLGLTAVALIVFKALPAWKTRRRGRLVRLDDPGLRTELDALARRAGLARVPDYYAATTKFTPSAYTFGSDRRPAVCLNRGLLWCRETDPERFRTVVLHEFAHLRNRDVSLTYATVAAWWSFLLVVAVPFAVFEFLSLPGRLQSTFATLELQSAVRQVTLAVVVLALVHLARQEVLRSRELHADRTALAWGADMREGGLGRLRERRSRRRIAQWFTALTRSHPTLAERREALGDDSALYAVRNPLLLATGATAALTGDLAADLFARLPLLDRAPVLFAGILTAALVTGVVGRAVWGAVAHAVQNGAAAPAGVREGALLGIGMVIGETLRGTVNELQPLSPHPETLLLLFGGGLVFGWWTATCARLWVTALGRRSEAGAMALVLIGGGIAVAAALSWWRRVGLGWANGMAFDTDAITAELLAGGADQSGPVLRAIADIVLPFLTSFVGGPFILAGAMALWLVPLLARVSRPNAQVQLPTAAVLLGTAVTVAAMVGASAALQAWTSAEARSGAAGITMLVAAVAVALTAGAATAAAASSARAGRDRLTAALIAAHVALVVGLLAVTGLLLADGCVPPLTVLDGGCGAVPPVVAMTVLELIVVPVTVLVGAVAALTAALAAVFSRLHRRRRVRGDLRFRTWGRVAAAGLCAAAVGFTAVAETAQLRTELDSSPSDASFLYLLDDGEASPRVRGVQLTAWWSAGGSDLNERLTTVAENLGTIGHGDEIPYEDLGPECEALLHVLADAKRYLAIPHPEAQDAWEQALTEMDHGARACVNGVDQRNRALVEAAMLRLAQGLADLTTALEIVATESDAAGG